ncbi:Telomeric repeat-binding factor 1 [Lonchura striata]|uniref:Telomeric repeat-binding factor 1 n=1 Tax=Lonchura striata TaxID=40157 RepID=A0A218UP63_9PASE|nr:Telomeric repeat-binding factor 1 [Lonchura striata domestica]
MATAARGSLGAADGSGSSVDSAPPEVVEAVATEWMLEFACSSLCRHFAEQSGPQFWRWRDVAQVENDVCGEEDCMCVVGLTSAIVAVHMENRYFKEAAEVLERLFTDSESDKPLRVKLATIIKTKDPYVPLLQSFSYSLLIRKIKSYIELFMKENETNFLRQEATKHVTSKGLRATLQNRPVEVNENDKNDLETKQSVHSAFKIMYILVRCLNDLQNVGKNGVSLACSRKRQLWTHKEDLELKSGVRQFGVGNWAKILAHGNFNNRTSVMLKDRWRTLSKIKQS